MEKSHMNKINARLTEVDRTVLANYSLKHPKMNTEYRHSLEQVKNAFPQDIHEIYSANASRREFF